MKLYLSPGACSRAVHIALHETGLPFETERVDSESHTTASGADYYAINPKGYVPCLEIADGTRLTEVAALLQFVADRAPERGLAPPNGTFERTRLQEMLNFLATGIHKTMSPLWSESTPEAWRILTYQKLEKRLPYLDLAVARHSHLMSDRYGVADAYLFTLLGWARPLGVDLGPFSALQEYRGRIRDRPAVQATLAAES